MAMSGPHPGLKSVSFLSGRLQERIDTHGLTPVALKTKATKAFNESVHWHPDVPATRFLPLDGGGKVGVKQQALHPPLTPPIKEGEGIFVCLPTRTLLTISPSSLRLENAFTHGLTPVVLSVNFDRSMNQLHRNFFLI